MALTKKFEEMFSSWSQYFEAVILILPLRRKPRLIADLRKS